MRPGSSPLGAKSTSLNVYSRTMLKLLSAMSLESFLLISFSFRYKFLSRHVALACVLMCVQVADNLSAPSAMSSQRVHAPEDRATAGLEQLSARRFRRRPQGHGHTKVLSGPRLSRSYGISVRKVLCYQGGSECLGAPRPASSSSCEEAGQGRHQGHRAAIQPESLSSRGEDLLVFHWF